MKLQSNGPVQGSFGIPPQVAEAAERQRKERDDRLKKQEQPKAEASPPPASEEPTKSEEKPLDQDAADSDPVTILEKMGARFNDEDFQKLLFKGFYETELEVVKGKFKATIRTLTGQEFDEVDELLATEVKDVAMTNDGYQARRAMLVISYGVTHLMGKPVAKTVMNKDKTVDTKATALERRKVLGALAPMVTNRLIQMHGAITTALNLIVANPEKHLKNS